MADAVTASGRRNPRLRLVHRELVVLLWLAIVAVGAFLLTRAFAGANGRMRKGDAAAWYAIGQQALSDGRSGDGVEARRYYQSALNSVWRVEQSDVRRRLRLELITLLLAHDEKSRALSEILALSANLPDTAVAHVETARLFVASGDPRHALDQFAQALARNPRDGSALAGAGEAAFALGDYPRARRYLSDAPRDLARVVELRELTDLVLTNDPMAPRIPADERTRRLFAGIQHARQRVVACLAASSGEDPAVRAGLEALQRAVAAFEPTLSPRAVREKTDILESGLELVQRMEQQTERGCAPVTARDRALLLIAAAHGIGEP